jgi:hypothetical protein
MFNSVNPTPLSVDKSNLIRNGMLIVLLILLVVGVSLIIYYRQNIYDYFYPPPPPPPPSPPPPEPTYEPPPPPPSPIDTAAAAMVEMVLPERRQVFNISENRYTFYDAEPLCKALGAELATYDQVKEAYAGGGDWCNYGWSVGQMALYPTQDETWQKLQSGPEGQRMSCGTVGINGGYFDNPELRFGVNCYGTKPVQKNHDASVVSNNDSYPQSPETIEFDKKVSKFKSISDTIGILPFKKNAWSA